MCHSDDHGVGFSSYLPAHRAPQISGSFPLCHLRGCDFHSVGYGHLHKAHLPASTGAALQSASYRFKFMTTECELQTQITNSLVLGRPLKWKKKPLLQIAVFKNQGFFFTSLTMGVVGKY